MGTLKLPELTDMLAVLPLPVEGLVIVREKSGEKWIALNAGERKVGVGVVDLDIECEADGVELE